MIKYLLQKGLFDFTEAENPSHDTALNMMTGKHLMEVYYWQVPVFRCNMGLSIDDDVFFSRVNYKGNTAIVTQSYSSVKARCGNWSPDEVFASNAVFNFCRVFSVPIIEMQDYLKGRRKEDSLSSKKTIEQLK